MDLCCCWQRKQYSFQELNHSQSQNLSAPLLECELQNTSQQPTHVPPLQNESQKKTAPQSSGPGSNGTNEAQTPSYPTLPLPSTTKILVTGQDGQHMDYMEELLDAILLEHVGLRRL